MVYVLLVAAHKSMHQRNIKIRHIHNEYSREYSVTVFSPHVVSVPLETLFASFQSLHPVSFGSPAKINPHRWRDCNSTLQTPHGTFSINRVQQNQKQGCLIKQRGAIFQPNHELFNNKQLTHFADGSNSSNLPPPPPPPPKHSNTQHTCMHARTHTHKHSHTNKTLFPQFHQNIFSKVLLNCKADGLKFVKPSLLQSIVNSGMLFLQTS